MRERWLASAYKGPDQLVFCKANGEDGDYRDAGTAFRAAVKAAGLRGEGALASLAARRLRLAPHRQGVQRRVCLPPARALQPDDHPRRVRASLQIDLRANESPLHVSEALLLR